MTNEIKTPKPRGLTKTDVLDPDHFQIRFDVAVKIFRSPLPVCLVASQYRVTEHIVMLIKTGPWSRISAPSRLSTARQPSP